MWDLIVSVPDHCLSFYSLDFLLHMCGSIDFVLSASLVLYSIIITLIGEDKADLYVIVYQ